MIGRLHHVVIDCPDPKALAAFYSALLGRPVTYSSDDFVVVADNDRSSGLAFQLAPDHVPPSWPDPRRPQQIHLDVMVDDLETADPLVQALGARPLGRDGATGATGATGAVETQSDSSYWVYADPAGHPFCLIRRPSWADPVETPTGR